MKILWITNILFPEALSLISEDNELRSSGGWMLGAANALIEKSGVSLYVATVSHWIKKMTRIDGEKIHYYVLPYGKGNLRENPEYQKYWIQIKEELSPDVVHIHGTEFSHGHAYMKACGCDNVIVSIQGLKSACYHYYYYGISKCDIFKNITLRDILRGTILKGQRDFKRNSRYEKEMLSMTNHIIGRTSWDRAHALSLNPNAQYHFCNEILRAEFYGGEIWDYKKCKRYTIFLSQAGYPIKGLHQLLKAMPLILKQYPETRIRIAGQDITKSKHIEDKLRLSGYGLYIKRLIKRLKLQDKVCFIGSLNAEQMKYEYMCCNVFVCPSSIENSPNSIGEAQILGVPCVASYVGGIPDMMKGNEDNLYRFEEIEMLAQKVCRVFDNGGNQCVMIDMAMRRHNSTFNTDTLLGIYNAIMSLKYEV